MTITNPSEVKDACFLFSLLFFLNEVQFRLLILIWFSINQDEIDSFKIISLRWSVVVMIVMGIDLERNFFCLSYFQVQDTFSQSFNFFQVLDWFSCDFTKNCVFVVHKWAWSQSDCKPAVVSVLFADTGQKAWSVVQHLEWFVSKSGTKNWAITLRKMAKFNVSSGDKLMNAVINERKNSALVVTGSKK